MAAAVVARPSIAGTAPATSPPVTAPAPAPHRTSGRMRSIDLLRGLAVLGMILVNNQGSGAHAFWGMAHADWNGWSPADLVFPTFLFVVGASMAITMARRPAPLRKVARRAVLLFAMGFAMNALPPTVLAEVRIMGVLQRIGLAFLLASLVTRLPLRRQVQIAAVALVGYWLLVAHWPMSPDHSLPGMVDRFLLGSRHVYKNGGYDPEGLLSTIPATVSVLAGYWSVRWLRRQPVTRRTAWRLAGVGAAVAVAGQVWGALFPINKRLWTSSYVVLMAGLAMMILAAAYRATEVRERPGRFTRVLEVFGMNALVVFAGSEILTGQLKATGLRVFLYDHLYAPLLGFRLGSLTYGLVLTALWWAVAYAMWRRRIFVKV